MKKIKTLSVFLAFLLILSTCLNFNAIAFEKGKVFEGNENLGDLKVEYLGEKYIYPITPEKTPEKWNEFTSHSEMIAACEIPKKILNKLTTKQLLRTCLDYPLNGDALFYSDFSSGFDLVSSHHNGLLELFERKDFSSELSDLYDTLTLDNVNSTNEIVGVSLITMYATVNNLLDEVDVKIINNKCAGLKANVNTGIAKAMIENVSQTLSAYFTELSSATYSYNLTTVYTKKGTGVTGYVYTSELSASDIAYYNNYVNTTYPNATKISEPTTYYNCHSYAWYSSSYSTNHVWIPNPIAYRTDGSHRCYGIIGDGYSYPSGAVRGNKAYYSNANTDYDHSAIIYNSTTYTSKWGPGPLMRHAQTYCPYYYGSSSTLIYIYEA